MEVYLAPLQGLTDWIFRESFYEHIGRFDKTFAPFIRVQNGEFYHPSQCNDILPEHNTFQKPVPQFLGNDIDSFQRFEELCLKHQYTEVNINMGCPFIKVVSKEMGAGMLAYPDKVADLLEKIFATTNLTVSIKCRLGQEHSEEFKSLIPVFNDFPIEEMIIHPRVARQMYKGEVHYEAFARYASELKHPICYNGDIVSLADVEKIQALSPQVTRIMIGRGILQNPFLLAEIKGQGLSREARINRLRGFHGSLIERCKEKYSGDTNLLRRLVELWEYHAQGFEDGRKIFKQVKKCNTLAKYEEVIFKAINELK
ncbi:MAG: tRNA-dihydrouridine synthase family protein [Bacteroidota bacterium]|nr:tRNA-dihydrouridine synthase family protein [Bacteroidota bacterium]